MTRTRPPRRPDPIVVRAPGSAALAPAPRRGTAAFDPNLWVAEQQEDGVRWMLTFRPTAQPTFFHAKAAAWRFATSTTALSYLRAVASDVIADGGTVAGVTVLFHTDAPATVTTGEDPGLVAARLAHAQAAVAVLDGLLAHLPPRAHCASCDGWVTVTAAGWGHANACPACWTPRHGLAAPCPTLAAHHWCPNPAPARCAHCPRRDDLTRPCATGAALCCGCCLTVRER